MSLSFGNQVQVLRLPEMRRHARLLAQVQGDLIDHSEPS